MAYAQLKDEVQVSLGFKDQPRWVTYTASVVAVLIMSTCAVSLGIFMGYTYSYLEHRSVLKSVHHPADSGTVRVPQPQPQPQPQPETLDVDLDDDNNNQTLSEAFAKSAFVSRILKTFGLMNHTMTEEKAKNASWINNGDFINSVYYYEYHSTQTI